MNDTELDEMLNQWDAPPAPATLREKVRAGLAVGLKSSGRRWFTLPSWHIGKGLFAGMAAGAALFLVVMAQAFPQALGPSSPALKFPYIVRSDVIVFAADGSSRLDSSIWSYSYKGTEIFTGETYYGNPFQDFLIGTHRAVHYLLLRYVPGLVMPESAAKDAWFSAYVQAGCADKGDNIVGHDTILRHATTAVQRIDPDGWRGTVWRAPDLGCFAMRTKSEEPMPGGGYRVTRQRDAVRVFLRGGQPWRPE